MEHLIAPLVNLTILIGLLVYYLREPLRVFVDKRHHMIRDELGAVRNLLRGAQEKNEEFSSKLRAVDAEIAGIKAQMLQDAQNMKSKIVAEAQKLSGNVIQDAKQSSDILYAEFKDEVLAELGGRVIGRAEVLLRDRLTGDDRARIRKEFSTQVETLQ
jgi:F0F1-type ATP synthase membrane subunit b/b'